MTHHLPSRGLPVASSLLVSYLARERAFRGIGPVRAAALVEAFGKGLKEALLSLDAGVVDIIGEEPAITAAAFLLVYEAETNFLSWLDEIEAVIPMKEGLRIARAWGPEGFKAIKANPYLLLAVSDWPTVDALGQALGVAKDDLRRDVGAVEAVLVGHECLGRGSTRIKLRQAQRAAEKLLDRPLAAEAFNAAVASGAAVWLAQDLQPPGTAYMEAECALKLAWLAPQSPLPGVTPVKCLNMLVDAYEASQSFPMTEAQRLALGMAHQHRLLVLAGYAGSGKTTVLRGICETLEARGRKPLIITLSGRAAKCAAESTGRRAITVARFLVEQKKSNLPLGSDIALIADEASMLGLVEFWHILRRLGDATLLLCGDPAQLPPVSAGIVFHHLAGDHDIRKVVLDQVHRQSQSTGIPKLADEVRKGQLPDLATFAGARPGVTFTPCDRATIAEETQRIGLLLRQAGVGRDEMQIIAPTNNEIERINEFYHIKRLERKPRRWPGHIHIAEGEPVIWTKNDASRGLSNGSLGRVKEINPGVIIAELDGETHCLDPEDGACLRLAYAISVHKAQGSQWRKVIVPVFHSRIVDRSLIYTALTRAKDQVIFIGNWEAITDAVSRIPMASRRLCGFPDWLAMAKKQRCVIR
ncbi:MAG: AAA family ATPase [Limimaricola soesokkakensis]|uniref:AAA family ATPase n=1 Tax=Limimaricola soesokkakensis TaxID=1343159 RepID=UPI004057D250